MWRRMLGLQLAATSSPALAATRMIERFYSEYHGHELDHLQSVHDQLRRTGNEEQQRPCVFLAGDSSLDNKYWFRDWDTAVNGYEKVLSPPKMKLDVSYWLNKQAMDHGRDWFALNCAVEESALIDRSHGRLLMQDEFIRDNITENDTLIVSVGGNDIALKPTASTIANMVAVTNLSTREWIEYANSCECNRWSCTACVFRPPGLNYFIDMFSKGVKKYVERLISKRKPKRVVICMIYFPLEGTAQPAWADRALNALHYNTSPAKLQSVIKTVFHLATSQIKIEDTDVVPFPLFQVLDGKHVEDYVARVEPSALGGKKMGEALARVVDQDSDGSLKTPAHA